MDFSRGPATAAVFPHTSQVKSLSYHEDGVHLFVACQDSKLYVINSQTGQRQQQDNDFPFLKSNEKVDGTPLVVKSTHHDYSILMSGNKSNVVNYWSVYDNKLLRYEETGARVMRVSHFYLCR
jgi:WD40 repeat protein